jgi:hypothetical protein
MMFNDSLAPVEWSFSTYMRPTTSGGEDVWVSGEHAGDTKKFAVEGPLWGAMSGTTYDYAIGGDNGAITIETWEPNVFNFENSNKVALGVFTLYFVLGATQSASATTFTTAADGSTTVYQVDGCSVGSASVDFDIDGLAQVAWSGQGRLVSEIGSLNTSTVATKGLVREGVDSTTNFVRQKLTSMSAQYKSADSTGTDMAGGDTTYALTLTGGNITIENNLSYLTPETLGIVNQPLGHVMGTRSVSGNFTCYLNTIADGSAELFDNIIGGTGQITNSFDLDFVIGGLGSTPSVQMSVPRAHFEVPTHSIEDVISLDVAFHGLPADLSDNSIASGESEIVVTYDS